MEASIISENEQQVRKGVKRGSKRGQYRDTGDAKKRVMTAAIDGDWKMVAIANGVPVQTAYGWIRKGEGLAKARGGRKFNKMEVRHKEKILEWVSENPVLTLKQIKDKLITEENLTVSIPTIHKHLDGQLYTLKKVLVEPFTMNSETNKRKRAVYVESLMAAIGAGKQVVYIDESNCNLFLRRSEGRSKKGTRCSVKAATSRGPNIHIIGAITQTGLVYWERRRGSYTKDCCCEWLRSMLRAMHDEISRIVIVCDNAPIHFGLEAVLTEVEFVGVTLLRAAPYSAPLNPIEECWSVMKAAMKRQMAVTFNEMMARPAQGITLKEHRLQYLEATIDNAIVQITPLLCMRTCNHVQKHFTACLANEDLQMGHNATGLINPKTL